MPKHRDPLPEDLKELVGLIRLGKLFAVQEWIANGKRTKLPRGYFKLSPLRAAIGTGFHSIIEVLLKAGVEQSEKDWALAQSVSDRRLDLVELLMEHGADATAIDWDEILWTRSPPLMRWFIDQGMDLEAGYPIAQALVGGHREFLGIYMGMRDTVPSARMQADMALRVHCRDGRMMWVSLLMWAGADPRARVVHFEHPTDDEMVGTGLKEAVIHGRVDVVRKIKIDPERDNVSELLSDCWLYPKSEIVEMLVAAGADPNAQFGDKTPMDALFRGYGGCFDRYFGNCDADDAIRCIEIAASAGGRWRPSNRYELSCLRRSLSQGKPSQIIVQLNRIVASGAIEKLVLRDLMSSPKMKELLTLSLPGCVALREAAGFRQTNPKPRRNKTKPAGRGKQG